MIFEEKNITLKNGRMGLLRAPRVEDAAGIVEYLRAVAGETEFLNSYPEEVRYTTEGEAEFLRANLAGDTTLMILCTVEGELAGFGEVVFNTHRKTRHRADVHLALLKRFWGLGIGGAMLDEMEKAARKHGTELLELSMIEGNGRALALYEKKGFRTVAVVPDAYRLSDGSHAEVIMRKDLKTEC